MGEDDARFLSAGDDLVRDIRRYAKLTDHGVVVDVGSGYGRHEAGDTTDPWPDDEPAAQ